MWLSGKPARNARETAATGQGAGQPLARALASVPIPVSNMSVKSEVYWKATRSLPAASRIASKSVTSAGPRTSWRTAVPSPAGAARRMALNADTASRRVNPATVCFTLSRRSQPLCAAAASGAHRRTMPRLVVIPTPAKVASTAARMRAPTGDAESLKARAAASALRKKSSAVMPWPSAKTWTLPGFGASISSRHAATNASAISFTRRPPPSAVQFASRGPRPAGWRSRKARPSVDFKNLKSIRRIANHIHSGEIGADRRRRAQRKINRSGIRLEPFRPRSELDIGNPLGRMARHRGDDLALRHEQPEVAKGFTFDRDESLKIIDAIHGLDRGQMVVAPDQFQAESLRAEQRL